MRNIYLPSLKKIRLENFTLYPNGLDFEYDFINGVNLIIGGNGMGKTTFVNIIKYAIIGNYKKGFELTRTYQGEKIAKRLSRPNNYFSKRKDNSIITTGSAKVTIEFEINTTFFKVERGLEELTINSVLIKKNDTETSLEGTIITQNIYEIKSEEEKKKYINYQYEEEIAKVAGITFDELIFFVNEILFFGENHQTILWGNDLPPEYDVQNELFNNYFSPPELNEKRKEARREAKYFNSLSRHRSEDIRAIKKVLENIEKKKEKKGEKSIKVEILNLKNQLEKIVKIVEQQQIERKKNEIEIKLINNEINNLSLKESTLIKEKNIIENKMFQGKWMHLHKNYDNHIQNIKANGICPMCSNELPEEFVTLRMKNTTSCFLCEQDILKIDNTELDEDYKKITLQLNETYNKVISNQKDIGKLEKKLKNQDFDFRKLLTKKNTLESKIRNLEYEDSKNKDNNYEDLKAFYDEIEELRNLKLEYQEKSSNEKNKAIEITSKIESLIAKNTKNFSNLFSEFAGNFLGVECVLAYTDMGNGKRLYPIIDGKLRETPEELSESQRFFVDHSFRMSILSFFYSTPAFYIVETPDSSLDISYELNAAKVFMKFLEKPNSLILTTNLNNSEFLTHLIKSSQKISIINLLEIGRKSDIQKGSKRMKEINEKIQMIINNEG